MSPLVTMIPPSFSNLTVAALPPAEQDTYDLLDDAYSDLIAEVLATHPGEREWTNRGARSQYRRGSLLPLDHETPR